MSQPSHGNRTKAADRKKIIKMKLDNPELSSNKIAQKTGISTSTVCRIHKELPKYDKEWSMVTALTDIVNMVIDIQQASIANFKTKSTELTTKEIKDLSDIAKSNRERVQILEGKPIDIKKYDFDFRDKTTQQLEDFRKTLLNNQ